MSTTERELHRKGNPFLYSIPSPLTNEIPHLSVYDLLHSQLKNDFTRDYIGTCKTYYEEKENIKTVNGYQANTYLPRIVPYISTEDNSFMVAHLNKVNFEVNGVLEPEYDYLMHEMVRYLGKLYPDNVNTLTTLTHAERDGYFNEVSHMIGSSVDLESYLSVESDNFEDLYYKYNYVTNYRVLKNTIGSISAPQRFLRLLPSTIDTTSYQVLRNNNNVPFIGTLQSTFSNVVASANVFVLGDNRAISSSSVSSTAFDDTSWPASYMTAAEVQAALSDVGRTKFLVFTDDTIKSYFKDILVKAVNQAAFTSLSDDMTHIKLPQAFSMFGEQYPSTYTSESIQQVEILPVYTVMNYNHKTLGIAVTEDNNIASYSTQVGLQNKALLNTGATFNNVDTLPILTLSNLQYTEDITFIAFVSGIYAAANYAGRVITQTKPGSIGTMADMCVTLRVGDEDFITMVIDLKRVFGVELAVPALITSELNDIIINKAIIVPSAFSSLIETYVKYISHPSMSYSGRGKDLNIFSANLASITADTFLIPSDEKNELISTANKGIDTTGDTFGKSAYNFTASEVKTLITDDISKIEVQGKNESTQSYISLVYKNSVAAAADYVKQAVQDISSHITTFCKDTYTQSSIAVYGIQAPMYTTISKATLSAKYTSSVEQIVLSEISYVKVNNVDTIDLAYNGESPDLNYAVAFGFSFNTNEYTKAISAEGEIIAADIIRITTYENEVKHICEEQQYPQFVIKAQDGSEAFGKVVGCNKTDTGLELTVNSVNLAEMFNRLTSFKIAIAFNTHEKIDAATIDSAASAETKTKYSIRYNGDVIDVCSVANLSLTATVNQGTLDTYQRTWPADLSTAVFDTNSFIISLSTSSLRDVSEVFNKEESLFLDYSTSPVSVFAKPRLQNTISWTLGSNALTKTYTGAIPTTYGLIYDDQITDNYLLTYKKKLKETVEGLSQDLSDLGKVDLSSLVTTVGYSLILWNYVVWDTYQEKTIKYTTKPNDTTGEIETVYSLLPEEPVLIDRENNTYGLNYRTLWSGWLSQFDVKVSEDFFLTNEDILQLPTSVYKTFLISEYNFSNANCLPYGSESNLSVLPYFTSLIPYTKSDTASAATNACQDTTIPNDFSLKLVDEETISHKAMSVSTVDLLHSYGAGNKCVYFSKSTVDRDYVDDLSYGPSVAQTVFSGLLSKINGKYSYNPYNLINSINWVSTVASGPNNDEASFFSNIFTKLEFDSYVDEKEYILKEVLDEKGNPIYIDSDTPEVDEGGNVVTGEDGKPKYIQIKKTEKVHPEVKQICFTTKYKNRFSINDDGYTCFDTKPLVSLTGTICNGFADYSPLKSVPSVFLTNEMAIDDPSGLYEVYSAATTAFSYFFFDMLKWYAGEKHYGNKVFSTTHNGRSINGLELAYTLPNNLLDYEGNDSKRKFVDYYEEYLNHFQKRYPCVPFVIGKNVTSPDESNIYCFVPVIKTTEAKNKYGEVETRKEIVFDIEVLSMYHRTLLQLCTVGDVVHMNTKENSAFIKRYLYLNSFQMSPSAAIEVTPLSTKMYFDNSNEPVIYKNTQTINFNGSSLQFDDEKKLSVSVPTTAYIKAEKASFKLYTENDNSYEILPCSVKITDGDATIGDTSTLVLFDLSEVVLRTSYSVDREIQLVDRTYDVPYSHVYAYKETKDGAELILGTNPRNANLGIQNTSLAITPSKALKNENLKPTVVPAELRFGEVPSAKLTDEISKLNYDYIKVKFVATGVMSSDNPNIITIKDDISIAEHIDVGDSIEIIANTVFPSSSQGYQDTTDYEENFTTSAKVETKTLKVIARHDVMAADTQIPYTILACTDGEVLYLYNFVFSTCKLTLQSQMKLKLNPDPKTDPYSVFTPSFNEIGLKDEYISYILSDADKSRMILKNKSGEVVKSYDFDISTDLSGYEFDFDPTTSAVPHYIIGKSGLVSASVDADSNEWTWKANDIIPDSIKVNTKVSDANFNTITFTNNGLVYYESSSPELRDSAAQEATFLNNGNYDKISASEASHEDFIHYLNSEGKEVDSSYVYTDPVNIRQFIIDKVWSIFGITDSSSYEYDPSIVDTLDTVSKAVKKAVTTTDGVTGEEVETTETTGGVTYLQLKEDVIKMRLAKILFNLGDDKVTVTKNTAIYRFDPVQITIPVATDYNYGETYTLPMEAWLIKPYSARIKLDKDYTDVNSLIYMAKALADKTYISKTSTLNTSSVAYNDDDIYATFDDATASFRVYRKGDYDLEEVNNKAITELLAFKPYSLNYESEIQSRVDLPVKHNPLFFILDDETKPVTNTLVLTLDNFDTIHDTQDYKSAAERLDGETLPKANVPATLYDLVYCYKHILAEPDHDLPETDDKKVTKPDYVSKKLRDTMSSYEALANLVESERKTYAISETIYGSSLSVVFNESLLWLVDASTYIDGIEEAEGKLSANLQTVRDIIGTNKELSNCNLWQLLQQYVDAAALNKPAVPLPGAPCLANSSVKIKDPDDKSINAYIPLEGTLTAVYGREAEHVVSYAHSKGMFRYNGSIYTYGYVEWKDLETLVSELSMPGNAIVKDSDGNPIVTDDIVIANNILQAIANYARVTTDYIEPQVTYNDGSYTIVIRDSTGKTIDWKNRRTPFLASVNLSSGAAKIVPLVLTDPVVESINGVFIDGVNISFFGVSSTDNDGEKAAYKGQLDIYSDYASLSFVARSDVSIENYYKSKEPCYTFQNNALVLSTAFTAINDVANIQGMAFMEKAVDGSTGNMPVLSLTSNSLVSSSGDVFKYSTIRRLNSTSKTITLTEDLFNAEESARNIKVIVLVSNLVRDNLPVLTKVAPATLKRLRDINETYMFLTSHKEYADFATPIFEAYDLNEDDFNERLSHMVDYGYEEFNNGIVYERDEDENIVVDSKGKKVYTYDISKDTTELWKYTTDSDGIKVPEIATNDYGRVIYRAEGLAGAQFQVRKSYETYFEDIRGRGDLDDVYSPSELADEFKNGCNNLTPMVALPDDPIAAFNDYTKFLCWSAKEATGSIETTADKRFVKVTLKDKTMLEYFKKLEEDESNTRYSSMVPETLGLDGYTFLTGCALYKFKVSVPYRTLTLPKLTPISSVASKLEGALFNVGTDVTEVYIPRNGYAQELNAEYAYPEDNHFAEGIFYYNGTYEDSFGNKYAKGATINANGKVMTVVDVDTMEPTLMHFPAPVYSSFAEADAELPIRVSGRDLFDVLKSKNASIGSSLESKLIDLGEDHKGIKIEVSNGTLYNKAITFVKESMLPLPYEVFKNGIEFSAKVYSSSAVDSYQDTKDLYKIAITSEGATSNLVKPSRVLVTKSKSDSTPLLPTTKFWNTEKEKSEYYFSTIPSLNSALTCDGNGHTQVMHTNGIPITDDKPDAYSRIKGVNYKAITRQAFNSSLATNKLTTTRITSNSDRYSIGAQLASLKLSYFKSALKESTDQAVIYSVECTNDTTEAITKSMSLASLYRCDNGTDPTMDIYYTSELGAQLFCTKIEVSDLMQIKSYVPASTEGNKKVKAIIFYDVNGNMVSQTVYNSAVPIKATFVCTTI